MVSTLLKLLVRFKYIDWYKNHPSFDVFLIQADLVVLLLALVVSQVMHFFLLQTEEDKTLCQQKDHRLLYRETCFVVSD